MWASSPEPFVLLRPRAVRHDLARLPRRRRVASALHPRDTRGVLLLVHAWRLACAFTVNERQVSTDACQHVRLAAPAADSATSAEFTRHGGLYPRFGWQRRRHDGIVPGIGWR